MLNGLDLFSGFGGLTLALSKWVRPVAYCEQDRYAQALLLSRMFTGDVPTAPIWDDVRTLTSSVLGCGIDIIYGGFPCQDVSVAGARKGLDGERTGLFREAIRLVRECEPQFVFLENVPGIRKFVPTVRSELEALGYDCRDGFLSAAEVGANHIRNRWWLLAYASSKRRQQNAGGAPSDEGQDEGWPKKENNKFAGLGENVANTNGERLPRSNGSAEASRQRPHATLERCGWWAAEPNVGRVANGIPARVDRLRGLGNAVVPAQAREAFKRLMGLTNNLGGGE